MNIVLEGVEEDSPVYLLGLLTTKILFMYCADRRWRNVTLNSVRRIDREILRKLLGLRIIRYEGPLPNWVWAWNNFHVLENGNTFTPQMFNSLSTQQNGGGWMNEGHQRYVEGEGHDRYLYCAVMQVYVNLYVFTRRQDRTSDDYETMIHNWAIYRAINALCDVVFRKSQAVS